MIKKIAKKIYDIIVTIIIFGCPICFFIVMRKIPFGTLVWLLLPLISIIIIYILHFGLFFYEYFGNYSERFLNRCCWFNFIIMTLFGLSLTAFFYTCYIGLTIVNFFNFENTSIYIYIFTFIACRATLLNSTPYYIQKLKKSKTPFRPMIDADANRVVIMMSYFVFLLVTQIKSSTKLSFHDMLMLGFMFYLAFDRLYASIISNLPTYKDIFDYMKQDHETVVKKRNKNYCES